MNYVRQITDYDTGTTEWVELGEHRPLSAVADELEMGHRAFRDALVAMGLLQREWDDMSKQHRHRLTPGAVRSGFGVRHDNKGFAHDRERTPFDVLSPAGVQYVRDRLSSTLVEMSKLPQHVADAIKALARFTEQRRSTMTAQMKACWLVDHYPALTASQIADGIGVSRRLVDRFISIRARQLREAQTVLGFTSMSRRTPTTAMAMAA
jgi:hypothetical protein